MNKIFVDTSGWGNLVDTLQEFHTDTRTIYLEAKQNGSRLVTTNYVVAELIALLSSPMRISRAKASSLLRA